MRILVYARRDLAHLAEHYARELNASLVVEGLGQVDESGDLVVVVGGDGTLLRAIHRVAHPLARTFLLGGAGRVGFYRFARLDEVPPRRLREIVDRREYTVVQFPVIGFGGCFAVNEIVIRSTEPSTMPSFEVSVRSTPFFVRADAVVVSTPQGVPGYAISIGAPIVDPSIEAAIVSFIAPYTLSARPIVAPIDPPISIRAFVEFGMMEAVCDGYERVRLGGATSVEISSAGRVKLAMEPSYNFLSRVAERLGKS